MMFPMANSTGQIITIRLNHLVHSLFALLAPIQMINTYSKETSFRGVYMVSLYILMFYCLIIATVAIISEKTTASDRSLSYRFFIRLFFLLFSCGTTGSSRAASATTTAAELGKL